MFLVLYGGLAAPKLPTIVSEMLGKTIVTTVGTDDTSIPTSGAVSKSVNNVSATAYFLSAV